MRDKTKRRVMIATERGDNTTSLVEIGQGATPGCTVVQLYSCTCDSLKVLRTSSRDGACCQSPCVLRSLGQLRWIDGLTNLQVPTRLTIPGLDMSIFAL